MSYMIATGACFCCKKVFSFNPHRVPSKDGEPICKDCMNEINIRKRELGLPEFIIPEGAYEPEEVPY